MSCCKSRAIAVIANLAKEDSALSGLHLAFKLSIELLQLNVQLAVLPEEAGILQGTQFRSEGR